MISTVDAKTDHGEVRPRGVNPAHYIEGSDRRIYVTKWHGLDRQFANELLGHAMASRLSIPTPSCAVVTMTEGFLEQSPLARKHFRPGRYFGSHVDSARKPAPGSRDDFLAAVELYDLAGLYDLLAFDQLIYNNDRKIGDILLESDECVTIKEKSVIAIDHGHAFTGPDWNMQKLADRRLKPVDYDESRWLFLALVNAAEQQRAADRLASASTLIPLALESVAGFTDITNSDRNAIEDFLAARAANLRYLTVRGPGKTMQERQSEP